LYHVSKGKRQVQYNALHYFKTWDISEIKYDVLRANIKISAVTLRSIFVACDKSLLGKPTGKKIQENHEGFAIFADERDVSEIILPKIPRRMYSTVYVST
jgi:hypothetical protein